MFVSYRDLETFKEEVKTAVDQYVSECCKGGAELLQRIDNLSVRLYDLTRKVDLMYTAKDNNLSNLLERIGALEKKVMEPLAQTIVNTVQAELTAHTRILHHIGFEQAISLCKAGMQIHRLGWKNKKSFVYYSACQHKLLVLETGNSTPPYGVLFDIDDYTAHDWVAKNE